MTVVQFAVQGEAIKRGTCLANSEIVLFQQLTLDRRAIEHAYYLLPKLMKTEILRMI